MAKEITLEQELDRILALQPTVTVPDELVWEPEPFEDQRAYASVEPDEDDPEGPEEETGSGLEGSDADSEGLEEQEEDA